MIKTLTIFFLLSLSWLSAEVEHRASIGSGLLIKNLELRGPKLKVIPRIDSKIPIVLRIVDAQSVKGGYRYDLYVEGLEEGQYNLANYLTGVDGYHSKLPEIPFETFSVLGSKMAEPRPLEIVKTKKIGGYTQLVVGLAVLWVVGLILLIFIRKKRIQNKPELTKSTLIERIHQLLVESNSKPTAKQKAQLDRLFIGHWRHQFPDLEHRPIADAIAFLKSNNDSAPMLLTIEQWLHSGKDISATEIEKTLAPYTRNQASREGQSE